MFKILVLYESNYLRLEIKAVKPHLSMETADFTVVSVVSDSVLRVVYF